MTIDRRSSKTGKGGAGERAPFLFDAAVAALAAPGEFLREAEEMGLRFEEGEITALGRYLAMLLAANAQMNLTGITEPSEAWRRHVLDSLTLIAPLAELGEGAKVADVGSGGGAPGVPLAITMPQVKFTLIEATGKKAEFLRAVAAGLGLGNVEVIGERAEEVALPGAPGRESFDAVVARAVGRLNVLAELALPLVKPGGFAMLIKGQKAEEELAEAAAAIGILGGRHGSTIETPMGRIVVLEKVSRTPRAYPRRPGDAKRAPIVG